ncbi:hypothetical protein [Spirosoma pulveris]
MAQQKVSFEKSRSRFSLIREEAAMVFIDSSNSNQAQSVETAIRIYKSGGPAGNTRSTFTNILYEDIATTTSATLFTLINRDFASLAAGITNNALLNQFVVKVSEEETKLQANFVAFGKEENKRRLLRVGGQLSAGLSKGLATLFDGKDFGSSISVGPRVYIDWFSNRLTNRSRYFVDQNAKSYRSILHKRDREVVLLNRGQRALMAKRDSVRILLNTGLSSTEDKIILLPILDALEDTLSKFNETATARIRDIELLMPYTKKKYFYTTLLADLVNKNVPLYDSTQTDLSKRFDKKDITGYIIGATFNYLIIKDNPRIFGSHFLSVGYEQKMAASLLEDDPAEYTRNVVYGTGPTNTTHGYTYTTEDVYVGDPKLSATRKITFNAVGFFTKTGHWGALVEGQQFLKNSLKSQQTETTIGLIIPVVQDAEKVTRLNVVLTLGFKDVFAKGDVTKAPRLWDRKVIGLRVGLPIKLDRFVSKK